MPALCCLVDNPSLRGAPAGSAPAPVPPRSLPRADRYLPCSAEFFLHHSELRAAAPGGGHAVLLPRGSVAGPLLAEAQAQLPGRRLWLELDPAARTGEPLVRAPRQACTCLCLASAAGAVCARPARTLAAALAGCRRWQRWAAVPGKGVASLRGPQGPVRRPCLVADLLHPRALRLQEWLDSVPVYAHPRLVVGAAGGAEAIEIVYITIYAVSG